MKERKYSSSSSSSVSLLFGIVVTCCCCFLLLLIPLKEAKQMIIIFPPMTTISRKEIKVFVKSVFSSTSSSSALLALLFFPFAQIFVSTSLAFLGLSFVSVGLSVSSSFGNYKAVICACVCVCARAPDSLFLVFCLGFTCTGVYDDALVFHYKYFMRARWWRQGKKRTHNRNPSSIDQFYSCLFHLTRKITLLIESMLDCEIHTTKIYSGGKSKWKMYTRFSLLAQNVQGSSTVSSAREYTP